MLFDSLANTRGQLIFGECGVKSGSTFFGGCGGTNEEDIWISHMPPYWHRSLLLFILFIYIFIIYLFILTVVHFCSFINPIQLDGAGSVWQRGIGKHYNVQMSKPSHTDSNKMKSSESMFYDSKTQKLPRGEYLVL